MDVLQGTLDLLILKAVSLGPLHGYGVLLRIQQISGEELVIQQGSLYPALYRLGAAGRHRQRVGRERQQPPRQVLPADRRGARPARRRDGQVEPHGRNHWHYSAQRTAQLRQEESMSLRSFFTRIAQAAAVVVPRCVRNAAVWKRKWKRNFPIIWRAWRRTWLRHGLFASGGGAPRADCAGITGVNQGRYSRVGRAALVG